MNWFHKIDLGIGRVVTITEVVEEDSFFRKKKINKIPEEYNGIIISETKEADNYKIEIDISRNNLGGGSNLEFIYIGRGKWQYLYTDPLKHDEKINNQNLGYYIKVKEVQSQNSNTK